MRRQPKSHEVTPRGRRIDLARLATGYEHRPAHEHHRSSLLAQWFPKVAAIDERRFPPPDGLEAGMDRLGLELLPGEERAERVERSAGDWEAAVRAGFVSTLHLLAGAEIEQGLDRFRAAHPDLAEVLEYRLLFRSVAARKPAARRR